MRVSTVAVAFLLVAFSPSQARAVEPPKAEANKADATKADQAKELNTEAQAEFYLGHFKKALELYEKVYKLKQVPSLLFNIAQCHRKLGEFAEAGNTYRSFLVHATPGSAEALNAQELLEQVEAAIKQGETASKSAPNEAMQPGQASERPAADPPPKPAQPAVPAPAKEYPAAPMVVVAPPPPPPPPPVRSHSSSFLLGGIGAAALAGGAVLGLISSNAGKQLSSGQHSRAEVDSLSSTKSSGAIAADALFVAALGLGAVAVLSW